VPLVRGANMVVGRGEVVLVVGAAGVGTSRIVAAALGELAASGGRIEVLGRDVGKLRRSSLRLLRRNVGIVPQDLLLMDDRSAQLNVVMPLEIDGVPRSVSLVRAQAILAALGLESEASLPIDCLSQSARQRVAVARALIRNPALVIADHPTSLQDAAGAELVCTALSNAAKAGAACLVFGRDPALRAIAEREGWRQLVMLEGMLRPIGEIALEGTTIEELMIAIESAPLATGSSPNVVVPAAVDEDDRDNVLPFPVALR
jgi:cell division transport system ATP-binding protein